MRAHYLQHVPFEGLGSIEAWLRSAGYAISCTPFYSSTVLPSVEDIDFLVVMGGPMSVNDEADYPWLVEEKEFIRQFIATGKPVVGICLGAQLIACAMGGAVFANKEKEIGWFPITSVDSRGADIFRFPESMTVFHWHGETFSLPPGSIRIAESAGCENQAFQLGNNVVGLQFHLETTPQSAQDIVANCSDELVAGKYIQSEQEILSIPDQQYDDINQAMSVLLDYLQRNC